MTPRRPSAERRFESITFTGVSIHSTVTSDTTKLTLKKVLVSKNGGPFRSVTQLNVNRGDHLLIRGTFSSTDGSSVTRDVPVVFLSAHDDYRETLRAAHAIALTAVDNLDLKESGMGMYPLSAKPF